MGAILLEIRLDLTSCSFLATEPGLSCHRSRRVWGGESPEGCGMPVAETVQSGADRATGGDPGGRSCHPIRVGVGSRRDFGVGTPGNRKSEKLTLTELDRISGFQDFT